MTSEIGQITKSKQFYRAKLAARPIAEKLRMLEELRKLALSIAAGVRENDLARTGFAPKIGNSRAR